MKEKIESLVNSDIKDLNVFVDDCFTSVEENKKILNIVLDSNEVIDLNKITEASRIINKKLWMLLLLYREASIFSYAAEECNL